MKNSPVRTIKPLTVTEAAVLGLLTRGEQSGYDLRKNAALGVGYFWAPAKSHIYAVLPRLVRDGLARRRDVAQTRRPSKQLYRLTAAGTQALREWLEEPPAEQAPNRNALLLKLYFADVSGVETAVRHVERHRAQLAEQLERYERVESEIDPREEDFFANLTLQYGLARVRASISWADQTLRALRRAAIPMARTRNAR